MHKKKVVEQAIAVFGESGSGKSVLVSSFYGATQEPTSIENNLYTVSAASGQHNRLFQDYLGMRDYARLPDTTRFEATSYSFSIKLKKPPQLKKTRSKSVETLRLVWHDYPGQWFEQDVSGDQEAQRRVDTFRNLLESDVALLLVDAQRLIDNQGQESKYLKSLFANVRNGLAALKDQLLPDGKPLDQFPRIWVLALSKSDLLPEMDVRRFRDLVVANAGADLDQIRATITEMVEAPDATSVFDDFVILSSAKFEPERIEVTQSVGLDLILPLAAVLPLERLSWWQSVGNMPIALMKRLAQTDENKVRFAIVMGLKQAQRFKGRAGAIIDFVLMGMPSDSVEDLIDAGAKKLRQVLESATAEHANLIATLADFRLRLLEAEETGVLFRRPQ